VIVGDWMCQERWIVFDIALSAAQKCLSGGIVESTECDEGLAVEDLCGCSQAVNSEQPEKVAAVTAARLAYEAVCPQPEQCALLDCAQATSSGTCQEVSHPDGICVFN
jgi:hypothetical protein